MLCSRIGCNFESLFPQRLMRIQCVWCILKTLVCNNFPLPSDDQSQPSPLPRCSVSLDALKIELVSRHVSDPMVSVKEMIIEREQGRTLR